MTQDSSLTPLFFFEHFFLSYHSMGQKPEEQFFIKIISFDKFSLCYFPTFHNDELVVPTSLAKMFFLNAMERAENGSPL